MSEQEKVSVLVAALKEIASMEGRRYGYHYGQDELGPARAKANVALASVGEQA